MGPRGCIYAYRILVRKPEGEFIRDKPHLLVREDVT
jgi:hypothetical protein